MYNINNIMKHQKITRKRNRVVNNRKITKKLQDGGRMKLFDRILKPFWFQKRKMNKLEKKLRKCKISWMLILL